MFEGKTREEIIKTMIMHKDITKPRPNENTISIEQTNKQIENAENNLQEIEKLKRMITELNRAKIEITTGTHNLDVDINTTYNDKRITIRFGYRLRDMILEQCKEIPENIYDILSLAILTTATDLTKAHEYKKWLEEIPIKAN